MRQIIAQLPEDLVTAFKQRCAEEDCSMRAAIEGALRRYVAEGRDATPEDVLLVTRRDVEKLLHAPLV